MGDSKAHPARCAAFVGLSAATLVAVSLLSGCWQDEEEQQRQAAPREADKDPVKAEREREKRQQVVAEIAVAPLPTGLPLIEREGKDTWGYPRSYVDSPAIRSLLHHQRFAELTQYFEQFQREFKSDPLKEFWPIRAAESFSSAEPALLPKLNAWVNSNPESFAPYLARGAYFTELAWARRGWNYAVETPTSDFVAMKDTAALGRQDLRKALEIEPQLMAADRLLTSISLPTSDEPLAETSLRRATQTCPSCFSIRALYIGGLKPRWGGSFAKMEGYAGTQNNPKYPRLKLLAGYADAERAKVAREEKRYDEALRFANAACALGDHWDFLSERAWVHAAMGDIEKASADADKAVEQRPELSRLRIQRAWIRDRKKAWEGAAHDLIEGIRVEATDSQARSLRPHIAAGLLHEGGEAHKRGEREVAIRLRELAETLAPGDRNVRNRKTEVVRGSSTVTSEQIAELEAKAKASPNDFRAHQQLDYALAKSKQYDRIIAMWTEYLVRNPNDGPAYFERGGAYFNSRHGKESLADAEKACSLGVSTACAYAKRMKGE